MLVGDIAGHDCDTVMVSGCRDNQIRLRKRMADFAALLNEQPPFEHDVFGNLEYAMLKHRSHFA